MRRRVIAFAAFVAVAALAVPAAAHAEVLGAQGARNMVHTALTESTESWQYSTGSRRLACRRMSPRSFRCSVSWYIGDAGYSGRVRARLVHGRRAVVGFVDETDDYCVYVTRAGNCTRTLRIRWHG